MKTLADYETIYVLYCHVNEVMMYSVQLTTIRLVWMKAWME